MTRTDRLKRCFSVLCLLVFAARDLRADSTFTVSNTSGAPVGTNSLSAALSGANGSSSSNDTISFNSTFNTPQTITLSGDLPSVSKTSGVTTTMSAPSLLTIDSGSSHAGLTVLGGVFDTSNVTFTGTNSLALAVNSGVLAVDQDFSAHLFLNNGTLRTKASVTDSGSMAVNGTFDVQGSGNTTTLSGEVDGASLAKTGAGTLVLTNTGNTVSAVTVNAGTLSVGSDAVLGAGTLTVGTAVLKATGDITSSRNLVTTGTSEIDATGHAAFFSGNISGSGGFTVDGGDVTFTGANTSSSGVLIDGGSLSVNSNAALGDVHVAFINGGTLRALADLSVDRNVGLINAATFDTNGHNITLPFTVSTVFGSGSLVKAGSGTLTLQGSNSYAGGTTVDGGILSISSDGNLGGVSGGVALNGGTLGITDNMTSARTFSVSSGGGVSVDSGKAATLSGGISGSGGFAKAGAGTLTLSGTNTYFGGTTVSGGVLAVSADTNLGSTSGVVFLSGGATLRFVNGSLIALNHGISVAGGGVLQSDNALVLAADPVFGSGGLTIRGAGGVELQAPNTYTGGTTVDGSLLVALNDEALGDASGGLTLANGGSFHTANLFSSSRDVHLSNGGLLVNDTAGSSLYSGVISGTGGLAIDGGGDTTLSGNNTYAGGTSVVDTALHIAGDSSLGAAGTAVALDDSGIILEGNWTSSRNIQADNFSGVDTNGFSASLSGNISGSGPFIKTGLGTLSFGGTASPGALVDEGTLKLLPGGALSGAVLVNPGATFDMNGVAQSVSNLTNNGTVRAGAATLTAMGYSGGGNLSVVLLPGNAPNVSAAVMNITGETLTVEGRPASGTYTVLNSITPLTGTFTSITAPAHKLITPAYTSAGLTLSVQTLSTLNRSGLGRNQASMASMLDASAATSSGDLDEVLGSLNDLSVSQQGAALTQASGVSTFGAMSGMTFSGSHIQSAAVSRRTAALRAQAPAVFQVADVPGDAAASYFGGDSSSPWGVFASALGGAGKQKSLSGDGGEQPGYDLSSNGVTLGVDRRIAEDVTVGASFGYLGATADIDGDGGSVKDTSLRYGVYGTAVHRKIYGSLYVGAASDKFDTERKIASLGRKAAASPKGREVNVDLQGGCALNDRLTAIAGLAHDSLSINGYAETGAGVMDLSVGSQSASSLRSNLGIKAGKKVQRAAVTYTPSAALSWLHEFQDQGRSVDASLASVGSFQTKTADVSRDGALITLGLTAGWKSGLSVNAAYNGEFRSGFTDHTVGGGFRWAF